MSNFNLETYYLQNGNHQSRDEGMCAMEFVAYLANEPHSDAPSCVSPLITSFIISCNDRWSDEDRQLLKPYLLKAIGTRDGKDMERAKVFAMHALTRISPHAIELIGLKDEADKMRACVDIESGIVAAEYAVNAAEFAAKFAAKYTTKYAAKSAANAASAAEFAAKYKAKYAAESAANAAESAAAQEYRKNIIQSCLDLLDEVLKIREDA